MAKKSPTQRIARLEDIVAGAGFLLMKIQSRYAADFGEGMRAQVQDCIRDCNQVSAARAQRQAATGQEGGAK